MPPTVTPSPATATAANGDGDDTDDDDDRVALQRRQPDAAVVVAAAAAAAAVGSTAGASRDGRPPIHALRPSRPRTAAADGSGDAAHGGGVHRPQRVHGAGGRI